MFVYKLRKAAMKIDSTWIFIVLYLWAFSLCQMLILEKALKNKFFLNQPDMLIFKFWY